MEHPPSPAPACARPQRAAAGGALAWRAPRHSRGSRADLHERGDSPDREAASTVSGKAGACLCLG
eukprot:6016280-Prymnesium_polylepis.1